MNLLFSSLGSALNSFVLMISVLFADREFAVGNCLQRFLVELLVELLDCVRRLFRILDPPAPCDWTRARRRPLVENRRPIRESPMHSESRARLRRLCRPRARPRWAGDWAASGAAARARSRTAIQGLQHRGCHS